MIRRLLIPALTAALTLLAACGHDSGSDDAKVVRIAAIGVPDGGKTRLISIPAVVEQQDWLTRSLASRGWKLEWVDIPPAVGGPAFNEAFAAKKIDFAYYGDLPALIARSSGLDIKIIQPGSTYNVYVLVPRGSPARSIADLKGKRIALQRGRPFEPSFLRLIEKNGMSLDDFTIVNIDPAAGTAALASNQVDALVTADTAAWVVADKNLGRILWSTTQVPESWKMRVDLAGRTAFIDPHPEITQIVADGFVRALAWSAQEVNREPLYKVLAVGGTPIEAVRQDAQTHGGPWANHLSPLFDDQIAGHYRYISDYAVKTGLIRQAVDPNALLDHRFSAKSLADVGYRGVWPPAPVRP